MHVVGALALEEIAGGCPLLDAWLIEAMADSVDATRLSEGAEGMALGYGCRVVRAPMPPGLYGLRVPGVIIVRAGVADPVAAIAVLHELGHEVVRRHRVAHTHADVWALTLAMGAPLRVLRGLRPEGSCAELERRTGMPAWACLARLEMGAVSHALRPAI